NRSKGFLIVIFLLLLLLSHVHIYLKGKALFNYGSRRKVIAEAFPEITFDKKWFEDAVVNIRTNITKSKVFLKNIFIPILSLSLSLFFSNYIYIYIYL